MLPLRQRGLLAAVGILAALLVVNASVAYRQVGNLYEHSAAVIHTQQAVNSLEDLLSTIKDAETGQRGYLVTAEKRFLEPYEKALTTYSAQFDKIVELTDNSPERASDLEKLRGLITQRMDRLAEGIVARDTEGFESVRLRMLTNRGKNLMDEIRLLVGKMEQREQRLLDERNLANERAYHSAWISGLLSSLAGMAGLAGLVLLLRRYLRTSTRAAAAVHEQRELLQATLISIGDAVIATDAEGRVVFLNTVAQTLTSYDQDEAQGLPLERVFCIVNESTREPVANPAVRALEEGRIVGLANHTILISKQGVEWPIDDSAAPIKDRQGKVVGAILVFREITARKQHETQLNELVTSLHESEEKFRMLADSMPQLAWMARPDGHLFWYNRRWFEFTGETSEAMDGWGWQSVHDPAHLPRVIDRFKAALASGEVFEDTFPLRRHDGVMRWHLTRAVPVRDADGQILRWFGTNTDITERMEMEHALKEADRRKDEFLATLAHELRNPLSPISNALQLWPMVENNPAEIEELRGMMERQVQQMTRLIDDLLDVSRITRGKIQLRVQRVDLSTIISGAIESMQPLIDACRHCLSVALPPEPIYVDGDVARLTQVFGNILNNAAKYTGKEGSIWISAEQEGREAVVRIRDNGPGIPPQMLHVIFEMFQQVDHTLERSYGGLGIGLTLVKRLVELHGGRVEARSEGLGHGSEFVVRLPIAMAPANGDNDGSHAIVTRRPQHVSRHRVLVVDDVRASAKTLSMMLRSIGQDVAMVHDGAAALDWLLSNSVDVVFLDIAMPEMSGYDVARHVRQREVTGHLTLVALTGYGQEDDRRRAIEAGFDHHMTKPTSMEALENLLATLPVQK